MIIKQAIEALENVRHHASAASLYFANGEAGDGQKILGDAIRLAMETEAALRDAPQAEGWVKAVQSFADELGLPFLEAKSFLDEVFPQWMADKEAAGCVTLRLDDLIEGDSYGVDGSDFYRCRICHAESGAGMLNNGIKHEHDCPLAATPSAPTAVEPVPESFCAIGLESEPMEQSGAVGLVAVSVLSAPTALEPDERADFEAWFTQGGDYDPDWLALSNEVQGQYFDQETENMWLAWQARASRGTK